jgi:NAD(P)-dependent dehydrogenase (short-subunit alcohol dehydrogenase family)
VSLLLVFLRETLSSQVRNVDDLSRITGLPVLYEFPAGPTGLRGLPRETALARASGPDDAPSAILYLCSSHASFVTGATLSVDGGNSAGSRAVYEDKKRSDA